MSTKNGLKLPNVAIAGVTGNLAYTPNASFVANSTVPPAFPPGAVGQEFLELLAERNFPFNNMKMLASARSAGKEVWSNALAESPNMHSMFFPAHLSPLTS